MVGTKTKQRRGIRLAAAMLALGIAIPGAGAHASSPNAFFDDFESYPIGALPGSLTTHPWEVKNGVWKVGLQQATDASPTQDSNKILIQDSRASTASNGDEPIAFVRALSFRSFTIQVTAAMMDSQNILGDLPDFSSAGIVFRAPVFDGIADKDNLYLFSAVIGQPTKQMPTGKAYQLFKRVARCYFPVDRCAGSKQELALVSSTWADFSKPHDYKVVVTRGHIQCFVDGRLVIEHTDIPSPDQSTVDDPLPGLPFDTGAVGLRTSGTRAWFDNLKVVGNDAYEARANAFDVYTNYGASGAGPQGGIRRGGTVLLSQQLGATGMNPVDTGFVYSDQPTFNRSVVSPIVNPGDAQPLAGITLGAVAANDTVTSTARMSALNFTSTEPTSRVSVVVRADGFNLTASASCTSIASSLNLYNATISITIQNPDKTPVTSIGPFPLSQSYPPNSVLFNKPGVVSVTAHWRLASLPPNRIDAAALRISFPEGQTKIESQQVGLPGTPVNVRTPETSIQNPPLEFTLAEVVAGRYCP